MEHEKILRINELAKKKKEVGLTDEEAEERKTLHAQYIKEFREQTEATLKRVRPRRGPPARPDPGGWPY